MAISLLSPPGMAWTRSGVQLNGGGIYTYQSGTSTAKSAYPTYADALAGTNALSNPIALDSQGNKEIWLDGLYRIIVTTSSAGTPATPAGTVIETADEVGSSLDESLPQLYAAGLNVAIDTTDADHDISISAGEARDGADTADLVLASALIKQVDAAW